MYLSEALGRMANSLVLPWKTEGRSMTPVPSTWGLGESDQRPPQNDQNGSY